MNPKKRHIEALIAPHSKRRMARLRIQRVLEQIDRTRPKHRLIEDPIYDQLLPGMEKLMDERIIFSWYYVYVETLETVEVNFSVERLTRIPKRPGHSLALFLDSGKIVYK